MTIYRIEIICRSDKSTLKCSQSAHGQYGATQQRDHKLPIQSFADHLRHCCLLQVVALHCCKYGKHWHVSSLSQIGLTFLPFGCCFLCPLLRLHATFSKCFSQRQTSSGGKSASFAMASRAELSGIPFHFL